MPSSAHRSHSRADEAGFALIEVMAAAVLLVVITLATLSVFDTTSKVSASTKGRSIAANLAQQDQERMRAMKASDLSNYHVSSPVTVAGAGSFTVDSRAEWVRDAGGVESCVISTSQADYIRITSTVSASSLSKPVTLATLVAPPIASFDANTGTLTVQVTDRSATAAVSGADVSLSGPTSLSDTTNSLGCAVFSHIPVGTYSIKTHKSGYVDRTGSDLGTTSGVVQAGKVATYPATLDLAATATASIQTAVTSDTAASANLPTGTWMTSTWNALTADPQTLGDPNDVTSLGSPQSPIQAKGLFPFTEGDTFFTGSCAAAEPSASVSDYWSATSPANPGLVRPIAQGGSYTVTVRQPPLVVRLKNAAGALQPGAHVVITPTGCAADKTVMTTDVNGYVTKTGGTFDPGVPFGSYTVCADVPVTSTTYYVRSQTVQATSLTPSRTDMTLPNITSASQCS